MIPVWMRNTLAASEDGFFFEDQEECIPDDAPTRNPYVALARMLLRCRHGDFSISPEIVNILVDSDDDEDIWISASHLLAHAVPHKDLYEAGRRLLQEIRGAERLTDYVRSFVCRVWTRAMMLSAVPEMIELYRQTSDIESRTCILMELADMFEPTSGDLYDGIDVGEDDFDEPGYLDILMERYSAAMEAAAKAGTKLFYRGSPFSFLDWTHGLLARLADCNPRENYATDRMFFEGHTGIRCSSLFTPNGDIRPLAAAATIEGFLHSDSASKYEPGVRYFFGRAIPD